MVRVMVLRAAEILVGDTLVIGKLEESPVTGVSKGRTHVAVTTPLRPVNYETMDRVCILRPIS